MQDCRIHNVADASLWKGASITDPVDLVLAIALHRKHVNGRAANLTAIANLTGISRATVARRVARLMHHGFVVASPSGVSSLITLTKEGAEHFDQMIQRIRCTLPNG